MAVNEGSRYQTAAVIREVTEKINTRTGRIEYSNPTVYLDSERKEWDASMFNDNLVIQPIMGETPDQICNRLYGDSTLVWILCDFNDWVAENPFIVFEGEPEERLIMPSSRAVYSEILPLGAVS